MRRVFSHILLAALTLAGLAVLVYAADVVDNSVTLVAGAVAVQPRLLAADQPVVDGTITAAQVVAAQDGWVAAQTVQADRKLVLSQVVGTARVRAGNTSDLRIELGEPFEPGDTLLLTLHVDAGTPGVFEFPSSADRLVEQPGGMVSSTVHVLHGAAARTTVMPQTGASSLRWAPLALLGTALGAAGLWIGRRARSRRPR